MTKGVLAFISLTVLFALFMFAFIRYLKWVKENQVA